MAACACHRVAGAKEGRKRRSGRHHASGKWGIGPWRRRVRAARGAPSLASRVFGRFRHTRQRLRLLVCTLAPASSDRHGAGAQQRQRAWPHRGKHVLPRGAQVLQAGAHAGRGRSLQRADVDLRQVALKQRRIHGAQVLGHAVQQVQNRQLGLRPRLKSEASTVNPRATAQKPASRRAVPHRSRESRQRMEEQAMHASAKPQSVTRGAARRQLTCRICFSMAAATFAAATGPCALAISPAMMVRLVMMGLLLNVSSARPSTYCCNSSCVATSAIVARTRAACAHAQRICGRCSSGKGGEGRKRVR